MTVSNKDTLYEISVTPEKNVSVDSCLSVGEKFYDRLLNNAKDSSVRIMVGQYAMGDIGYAGNHTEVNRDYNNDFIEEEQRILIAKHPGKDPSTARFLERQKEGD